MLWHVDVVVAVVFNLYRNSFDHIPLYSIFDKQCWQFKWFFSLLGSFGGVLFSFS